LQLTIKDFFKYFLKNEYWYLFFGDILFCYFASLFNLNILKKMKKLILSVATISVMFFSCAKVVDPVVDPRDQILGDYTGILSTTILRSKIPLAGADTTIVEPNMKFKVEKSGSDITMDGIVGTKVTNASNGATFNIVSQTRTVDGLAVPINGFTAFTLGSESFSGGYISATKQLTFGITGTVTVSGMALEYRAIMIATK